MEASPNEQMRVVLTGLDDPSEEGIARFAQDLSKTFKIPLDKAETIARTQPYVVKKSCSSEMADRLTHTLGRLGAQLEIQRVAPPPKPETMPTASPPSAAAQGAPTGQGTEGMGAIGLARPAPGSDSGPEPSSGHQAQAETEQVACKECGSLQPADRKACGECYFPLPRPSATPAGVAESEAPSPGTATSSTGPVVFSDVASGYGELQQCASTVFVAAGLLFSTALINLWSLAFVTQLTGPSALISSFIDIGLGIGLLKGSSTARTWVLVRAVIGGFLWGLLALGTGDIAWFFFQEMFSVSLIVLLLGEGSLLKAVLVGIPNTLVVGLTVLGLGLMTLMGGLPASTQAAALLEEGSALQEQGRHMAAVGVYQQALEITAEDPEPYLRAEIYKNLGSAYMGMREFARAIPELQASVALDDRNAESHYLLAMAYFQTGDSPQAMAELVRVEELDPDYPELESSMQAVRHQGGYRY